MEENHDYYNRDFAVCNKNRETFDPNFQVYVKLCTFSASSLASTLWPKHAIGIKKPLSTLRYKSDQEILLLQVFPRHPTIFARLLMTGLSTFTTSAPSTPSLTPSSEPI